MKGLETIVHEGTSYAMILRDDFEGTGLNFLTPNDYTMQVAHMRHPAQKIIQPHSHNPIDRTVSFTFEVLLIKKGRLRVTFFDDDRRPVCERVLGQGDLILLMHGGHGFEVLEDLEMIEVKQGPYAGDLDKTKF